MKFKVEWSSGNDDDEQIVDIADLDGLLNYGKTLGHPIILHLDDDTGGFTLEIYDCWRE